nr:PREDICTED: mesenchyme-specific cell surface glycoprotein-like [Saccoglossus kowalevskii]
MVFIKLILSVYLAARLVDCLVVLEPISTLYLPYMYDEHDHGVYGLGKNAAEQLAYDDAAKLVYVVGDSAIHIIDVADTDNPTIIYHANTDRIATDVEICGDYVAITKGATHKVTPGNLYIYNRYDRSGVWNPIEDIQVGALPDMLHFTKDCSTIVVANEGEPGKSPDSWDIIDPEGTISIISLSPPASTIRTADFTSFNNRKQKYLEAGVRAPLLGQFPNISTSFSQNMEPEYIAFNEKQTTAYVTLQENNAIAEVDITSARVKEIHPLGFKNHRIHALDASDRDGEINIQTWPILGMYQPDAVVSVTIGRNEYLAIANEGDAMEIKFEFGEPWEEVMDGKDFYDDDLISSSVSDELKNALGDTSKLGRLGFSKVDNKTDKYDTFYSYGGRSFSVVRTKNMKMVYDSGSEMEDINEASYPTIFNMNGNFYDPAATPESMKDTRSDNKGPEPESLSHGQVNGKDILFIGQERMSTIILYHIYEQNGKFQADFESVYRPGKIDQTFHSLYQSRQYGDGDPEDLK